MGDGIIDIVMLYLYPQELRLNDYMAGRKGGGLGAGVGTGGGGLLGMSIT